MPGASVEDIAEVFNRGVEDMLKGTTMHGLVERDASRACAELFALREVVSLIAIVNSHGIGYQRQRNERITPQALLEFWATSPLADFAAPGLTLRTLASGPLATLIKDRDRFLWRVRQCWQCQTFFWAGRVDKVTCSSRCGDSRRQLLSRARKKEKGQQYAEEHRKNAIAAQGRRKPMKISKKEKE